MCGIGGVWIFDKGEVDKESLANAVWSLTMKLEKRGHDATGFMARYPNGDIRVMKAPYRATTVLTILHYFGIFDDLFGDCDTVLIHTRLATGGDPEVNKNNHPFVIPLGERPEDAILIGAHNGTCQAMRYLVSVDENREPETDSYAMFKYLGEYVEGAKDVYELRDRLEHALTVVDFYASFAIWMYIPRLDVLVLARDDSRPLYYWANDFALVFASESWMVEDAAWYLTESKVTPVDLKPGRFMIVTRDRSVITGEFELTTSTYYHGKSEKKGKKTGKKSGVSYEFWYERELEKAWDEWRRYSWY